MFHYRVSLSLLATLSLLGASPVIATGQGIQPIPDQDIPSGKTLVVPIPATNPSGPALSYTVTVGTPTTSGSATTVAGINASIRTGDPHFIIGVSYTDSNSVLQTGTMEFQLLREFSPLTTQIIGGLAQGGFYSPVTDGTNGTNYLTFFRIVPGFVIQGGSPTNENNGTPGFSFENEFSNALIFSGTEGQLAMANSGNGATSGMNGTNGSQFFVTLSSDRHDLDYKYTIFGQLLRGFDTLNGVAGTPLGTGTADSLPLSPVDITSSTVSSNNTDAVLLLSATGVCDADVTVTASSGTSSYVQTFTAHAVADTVSDSPFLGPIPDTTVPNGNLSLTLQGTDLQLDLLRYGYQRILPAMDSSVTSGTSPLMTIPLISNTDNTIAGTLDHWNASTRGNDEKVFHVGAGAKPLRGSLSPLASGINGSLAGPDPVAIFTSGNSKDTAASFTASVNWGDGTYLSGTQVSIVKDTGANRFKLVAGHTYTTAGEYPVIVKVADPGGAHLLLTGTANISPSDIAISGTDISNKGGTLKNQVIAAFNDGTSSPVADYSAAINWGDGTLSAGTIKSASASSYKILGSHVYQSAGTFTVSASVSRSGSNTASEWSAANISGVKAPQVFPPFPQAHLAQIWSVIYSDTDSLVTTGSGNGGNLFAPLVEGTDGNLYGTTTQGGVEGGKGTVFQLTTSGSLTTLYSFSGSNDGGNPIAGLITGTDNILYGTTESGGSSSKGTVYQITTSGSLTTLYSFTGGDDGGNPYARLLTGTDGNLYGTTESGGSGSEGTLYQITTSGSLTTLYSFSALASGTNSDGANPYDALTTGTDGNLYGTAESGGTGGSGTVFRLITSGSFTALHSFSALVNGTNPDGANSFASLTTGTDGNLYGTTKNGGANGSGIVFKMTTSGSFTTLYSFSALASGTNSDGANPYGALTTGTDGNLYGTTEAGGANGDGTLFQITTSGSLTTLHSFDALVNGTNSDGANPYSTLTAGTDGDLYGTTTMGGDNGNGTVFQITTSGALTTLYGSFAGNGSQVAVRASVAVINAGNKPSSAGSFSAYVDPNGTLDGNQTILTSNGESSFPIPALQPGQYTILSFRLEGSVVDTRLKLPIGFSPTGQSLIGVVTYSDPVADFDGSQKIVAPGFTF